MGTIQIAGYEFDQSLFMEWAEKIFFALAIVVITWALAKAAKWAFAKMVDQISFLQRDTSSGESVGMALGRIVSLLVWLFGLLAVLQQLGFDSVITPVQGLLGNFIGYVVFGDWPDRWTLAGAAIILASGLYAWHRERIRARKAAAIQ